MGSGRRGVEVAAAVVVLAMLGIMTGYLRRLRLIGDRLIPAESEVRFWRREA